MTDHCLVFRGESSNCRLFSTASMLEWLRNILPPPLTGEQYGKMEPQYPDIIMHVYIAPEPGNPVLRRCTIVLSLTQTCFHPAHISTPKRAYNACCHYRRKSLFKHIAIASCQVLIFLWMSEPDAT